MRLSGWLGVGFLFALCGASARAGTIWYVDQSATAPVRDGTTWCKAFQTIEAALSAAASGDRIRVAQGVYKPVTTGLPNPRNATFRLKSGVSLEGGYAGCGAITPDARDFIAFRSTLSGDLNGNDGLNFANNAENCYHVVTYDDPTATGVVLEGFTISGGNANGHDALTNQGGGIHIRNGLAKCLPGGPTIRHCIVEKNYGRHHGAVNDHGLATVIDHCMIRDNRSGEEGGGLQVHSGSPLVTHTTFLNNESVGHGGGAWVGADDDPTCSGSSTATFINCVFDGNSSNNGGGLYTTQGARPTIAGCTFVRNRTTWDGAGIFVTDSDPIVIDSVFADNVAQGQGGAVYNVASSPTFIRCKFRKNFATLYGGAMRNLVSNPILTDCVFSQNWSGYNGGAFHNRLSNPSFDRCAFFGNASAESGGALFNIESSSLTIRNSLFVGNTSTHKGGAISNDEDSHVTLVHCTLYGNSAAQGLSAINSEFSCTAQLRNSIVWNHVGGAIGGNGTTAAKYSAIQGGFPGVGNIQTAPIFVDADGPDNLLGTEDDDLRLKRDSPGINVGDPGFVPDAGETDLSGGARLVECRVDMGAHESIFLQESGDFNADRVVNLADFASFQLCAFTPGQNADWQQTCRCVFDFNGDEQVDLTDLGRFPWDAQPCDEGDDAACDDGDLCNGSEQCLGGICHLGTPIVCDDGNVCTDETCVDGACVFIPNSVFCDDQNACTVEDRCSDGVCSGMAVDCDDGNVCTTDTCSPEMGCLHLANTAPCDDGNACTVDDVCSAEVCTGGSDVACDDANPCTDDSCDPASGCVFTNNDENSCDDGDVCNGTETCSAGECSAGTPLTCDDGNPCTDDSCNPASGCVYTNNDENSCDDGNACNGEESCNEGICQSGSPLTCDDANPCTDDSCDPASGCVYTNNDENSCDDGDVCNGTETCSAGECSAGTPLTCDDGNPCTDDSCDPASGCVYTNNDENSCDDGDVCNGTETCGAGECSAGTPLTCDDGNPCTDDSCDPASGCVFTNNDENSCDDGDACTVMDACSDGTCSGTPVDCTKAGDACHTAHCDPGGAEGNCDILTPIPGEPGCDD